MAVKVSPLVHIEIVVPDAEEAYQFLHRVFGAEKVQEVLVEYLESLYPSTRCIHVELGGVVLQLVQPEPALSSWHEQLKRKGPGVHNLTFAVDNVEEAAKLLEGEGAPVINKLALDWDRFYEPGVSKEQVPPVHMVDTMDKIGFRLELVQRPKLLPDS